MRLSGVEWSDLGDPERLMCTLAEKSAELPAWAHRWWNQGKPEQAVSPMSAAVA
jgi:hypothetical protein